MNCRAQVIAGVPAHALAGNTPIELFGEGKADEKSVHLNLRGAQMSIKLRGQRLRTQTTHSNSFRRTCSACCADSPAAPRQSQIPNTTGNLATLLWRRRADQFRHVSDQEGGGPIESRQRCAVVRVLRVERVQSRRRFPSLPETTSTAEPTA
eukprot:2079113-Pleurochrysis_carterae.AAC.1